jgi:hypothetical protein
MSPAPSSSIALDSPVMGYPLGEGRELNSRRPKGHQGHNLAQLANSCLQHHGPRGRSRPCDLLGVVQVLFQLSYSRMSSRDRKSMNDGHREL